MFRLKEEFKDKLNQQFLAEAEPIMDGIYTNGGKCYTKGIDECGGVVLPNFIYVSGSDYQTLSKLNRLLTSFDKTDPDMQINSCLPISSSRDIQQLTELYEEV